MTNISLVDRIALVTGASSGIGRAIAVSLARAGASVAVGYSSNKSGADATCSECGVNSIIVHGDVGNPADAEGSLRPLSENMEDSISSSTMQPSPKLTPLICHMLT